MSLTHITNHYELAVARLPSAYRERPRYLAWLAAYCAKVQEIEDVVWDIIVGRMLQNDPADDLLAKLANLVQQPSWGLTDAEWRLMVRARILSLRSHGRRRDLIAVAKALWPLTLTPDVWVFDMVPAAVLLIPQAAYVLDPYIMYDFFLAPAVAAGVRLQFIYFPVFPSGTLMLSDSSGVYVPEEAQYLSDSSAAFTGGLLAGAI